MKNLHFFVLAILIIFSQFSCLSDQENDETSQEENATAETKENPLDSLRPEHISEDLSWFVTLDIQEGFLISYAITRQDGKEFIVNVEQENPAIGGIDHPAPHFINDSTYLIPVVGGSPNGHYEMYIYESGRHEFKEINQNH